MMSVTASSTAKQRWRSLDDGFPAQTLQTIGFYHTSTPYDRQRYAKTETRTGGLVAGKSRPKADDCTHYIEPGSHKPIPPGEANRSPR